MKLFQIYELDLVALEENLPALLESNMSQCNDPLTHKRWQQIKEILSNVRWNYGPPSCVRGITEEEHLP